MLGTLSITLYAVVAMTFIINLKTVFAESKQLKAEGKTPLTARNITTLVLAALGETLFVYLTLLISFKFMPVTHLTTGIVFVIGYIVRNVGAYLAAWGTWEVFVRLDKRKMKKQISEDQGTAL